MKSVASGLLAPEVKETFIGYAEIKEVFKITGVGKIAGCLVTEGLAKKSAGVRLLRDNVVIHEGRLKTLKRFKDDVKEVTKGYDCGLQIKDYNDIKIGDIVEAYVEVAVKKKLK